MKHYVILVPWAGVYTRGDVVAQEELPHHKAQLEAGHIREATPKELKNGVDVTSLPRTDAELEMAKSEKARADLVRAAAEANPMKQTFEVPAPARTKPEGGTDGQ